MYILSHVKKNHNEKLIMINELNKGKPEYTSLIIGFWLSRRWNIMLTKVYWKAFTIPFLRLSPFTIIFSFLNQRKIHKTKLHNISFFCTSIFQYWDTFFIFCLPFFDYEMIPSFVLNTYICIVRRRKQRWLETEKL